MRELIVMNDIDELTKVLDNINRQLSDGGDTDTDDSLKDEESNGAIIIRYDDKEIENYTTSFNLTHSYDKPDLRNVKYLTTTDHLNCPICQQPFIKPLTTLCGHTFCKDCIFECFKMSKDIGLCPLDRTPIDPKNSDDIFPTPILINNLVDDLKVYCLNSERGCQWTGCRWELDHHVLSDCDYTGVQCNGTRGDKKCQLLVERRFKNDEDTCLHEMYQCNFCVKNITKITESHHLAEECLFNYTTCEFCCNDMIPQKSLETHQQNCLKLKKFICPAKEIGCNFIGNNDPSLENHINNNCQLYGFLPFYQTLNSKIDDLTTENTFLQKQINKILNSVIQGKVTNLGYNEPIEEINKFKDFSEIDQDKLMYLNYELERLKYQVDEKLIPFVNKQTAEREPILNTLVNDNFMMKDDLNLQRVLINSLRKQIQFVLFKNHRPSFNNLNGGLFEEELSDSDERMNLKL